MGRHEIEARGDWPEWVPKDLVEWFDQRRDKSLGRPLKFIQRIATDQRMRDVWAWHLRERRHAKDYSSSFSLCWCVQSCMAMPGKPGNLPAKAREKYLAKVRKCAEALIELLSDTPYDHADEFGSGIDPESMGKEVVRDLQPWGEDDWGHLVAYWVSSEGVWKMPFDYPDSHLTGHLHELAEWTRQDDFWGRGGLLSSAPIAQAKGKNARVIYFNCTLYERLQRDGLTIPFPILATVANIAFSLSDRRSLDEDAVRKQVRRYEARRKRTRKSEPEVPF